jgi:hypothetical protein
MSHIDTKDQGGFAVGPCSINPRFGNQVIDHLSVDNLSKAGRIKIASARIDYNVLQVDVRVHRGEPDITKPG